jgi:hypothetical protein
MLGALSASTHQSNKVHASSYLVVAFSFLSSYKAFLVFKMSAYIRSQRLARISEANRRMRAQPENRPQLAEDEQQRPSAAGQALRKLLAFGSRVRNSHAKLKAKCGAAKSDPCTELAVVPYCWLQQLPIEVLELVTAQLDEVSTICLEITSRTFYHKVSVTPPSERSRCTRWLVACRREIDSDGSKQRLACAFCKGTVPKHYFTKFSVRQALSDLPYCLGPRNIGLPPEARYCSYHAPLTAHRKYEFPAQCYMTIGIKWVEVQQLRCMHCGNAVDKNFDTRETGCDHCCCNACPRVTGSAYIRYGPTENPDYDCHPTLREVNVATRKKETFCRERGSTYHSVYKLDLMC